MDENRTPTPAEAAQRGLSEQEQIRRAKLQRLVDEGRSPYLLTRCPVPPFPLSPPARSPRALTRWRDRRSPSPGA